MTNEDQTIRSALTILRNRLRRAETYLASPEDARHFLTLRYAELEHEIFGALWLNARHGVLKVEELFRGTVDGASVHPREVVKAALGANAAAVIFFHNHPSGIAEPSRADVRITARLRSALELVDVRLLDHLIVGGMDVTSLAERGLL
jgi:DNA repair protein radc